MRVETAAQRLGRPSPAPRRSQPLCQAQPGRRVKTQSPAVSANVYGQLALEVKETNEGEGVFFSIAPRTKVFFFIAESLKTKSNEASCNGTLSESGFQVGIFTLRATGKSAKRRPVRIAVVRPRRRPHASTLRTERGGRGCAQFHSSGRDRSGVACGAGRSEGGEAVRSSYRRVGPEAD